jgi:hypothetical protein
MENLRKKNQTETLKRKISLNQIMAGKAIPADYNKYKTDVKA